MCPRRNRRSLVLHVRTDLRPVDDADRLGVQEAHDRLDTAYTVLESFLAANTWAAGSDFSLADCSAAPALFYANKVHPIGTTHVRSQAYLTRLMTRPSFSRVLEEAEPYMAMFPG